LSKIILDLCGGTGAWSRPYQEAGYDVRLITLPDNDVLTYEPPANVYGILAAPPCTMFSQARRNKYAKPVDIEAGMEIVRACWRIIHSFGSSLKFWCLENPATGYLNRGDVMPPPTLVFHPYQYGNPYKKKTALWGRFNIPMFSPVLFEKPYTHDFAAYVYLYAHKSDIPPGYQEKTGYPTNQILRSITPSGFAKAFFEANQ